MTGRGGGWLIGTLVGCAAAVAVVLGLSVIDPPGTERMQKLDARRVEDMAAIIKAVDRYRSGHQGQLPETLDEIAADLAARNSISDRVTGVPYEYRIETPHSFRLCARFDTDGTHTLRSSVRSGDDMVIEKRTIHGAGLQCFVIRRYWS